jgi:ribonuclease M5
LKNVVTFNKNIESISWQEYLKYDWNKSKRKIVADHFQITESNNKQLFKRLNMMGINNDVLKKIISSYKDH